MNMAGSTKTKGYACLVVLLCLGCVSAYGYKEESLRELLVELRDRMEERDVEQGSGVVVAALKSLADSGVFPSDHGFLRRIAWVESKDGADSGTYRPGYYGGIWQVDKIGFEDTKDTASHPGLLRKYELIKRALNIDWATVEWADLNKPLYSALGARLFLSNVPSAIPTTLAGQADYWKRHYNSGSGAGTAQKFIDDVMALESK